MWVVWEYDRVKRHLVERRSFKTKTFAKAWVLMNKNKRYDKNRYKYYVMRADLSSEISSRMKNIIRTKEN